MASRRLLPFGRLPTTSKRHIDETGLSPLKLCLPVLLLCLYHHQQIVVIRGFSKHDAGLFRETPKSFR